MKNTQVIIYDTTLRDGAQTPGINLSVTNKLRIVSKLDEMGFPFIEGGWPDSNPVDKEFFIKVKELKLKNSKLVAFGMTGKIGVRSQEDQNLQSLLKSGAEIVTIFGKSWMLHIKDALKTTGPKNLETIYQSVKFLRDNGRRVFYDAEHFFDGYKDNSKYALQTLEAAVKGGAEAIILCDTNGGSNPEFIYEATKAVKEKLGGKFHLGIHAHNDSGLALANSLAAVKAGATQVHGTINGAGERAGNLDLCQFLPVAYFKYGMELGNIDLRRLNELSKFVEIESGFMVSASTPYVGKNAFRHKAGIHVSAMRRNPQAYEHLDPKLVGGQTSFEHSNQGGGSNIMAMAEKHGFELEQNSSEYQELVQLMKESKGLGDAQEFLLLFRLLKQEKDPFDVLDGSLVTSQRGTKPQAKLKVRVNGGVISQQAFGNGPINAFDVALRKALIKKYPEISKVELIHYRLPETQKAGTTAEVLIYVEFGVNGTRWTSVASSTDQQKAGEDAIIDGYKYYILQKRG